MHSIYIAAIVVTAFATAIYAGLLALLTPKEIRKSLLLLALIELPLQPLALFYVRKPLDGIILSAMGKTDWYYFVTAWYAPVTEELAKLLPVILFLVFKRIDKNQLRAWMLPISFGFGIGEAWLIAWTITRVPAYANTPWYMFGGFLNERLQVCFIHGMMTGLGLFLSIGKGRWLLGTFVAMLLHFFMNLPIYLFSPLVLNLNPTTAGLLSSLWVLIYFLIAIALVLGKDGAALLGRKLFGQAQCPRCNAIYDRPLIAVNMGSMRYERCPDCKTWNKTTRLKIDPDLPAETVP
ncbi:MAG: hypothetical protein WCO86_13540 [Planctomycetota bacterium]